MGFAAIAGIGAQAIGGALSKGSGKKQAAQTREAAEFAAEQVKPFQQTGTQANEVLAGALGLGGDPNASNRAFENFLGSTGFNRELQAGTSALAGNQATQGLLDSGSTVRGAQRFGQDLAQSRFQNFLGQLGGLSEQGLRAGESVGRTVNQAGQAAAGQEAEGRAGLQQGIGAAVNIARRAITS